MAKTFLEMLAAPLQTPESFSKHLQHFCKPQKVFRGTCSVPANPKKFSVAFAAFLQTPKSFPWHLQHSCKVQKVFRGICSIPANTKKFFEAFAAFLQRPSPETRRLMLSSNSRYLIGEMASSIQSTTRED